MPEPVARVVSVTDHMGTPVAPGQNGGGPGAGNRPAPAVVLRASASYQRYDVPAFNTPLYSGDMVVTGPDAGLTLEWRSGGLLGLQPSTRIRINGMDQDWSIQQDGEWGEYRPPSAAMWERFARPPGRVLRVQASGGVLGGLKG